MKQNWLTYHPSGKELDAVFYESYDPRFLYSKVVILNYIVQNYERAKEIFSEPEVELEDKDIERFNAEIYFSEYQLFEALFAFLLAPFQEEPHSVFLLQYTTKSLKEKAKLYLENRIPTLTGEDCKTQDEFLKIAIYADYSVTDFKENWSKSLNNIKLVLGRLCQRYLQAPEYNSYKHGVRISTGPSFFGFSPTDKPESKIYWQSDNSVSYLEINRTKGTLELTTKHYDPKESMLHMQVMTALLETIIASRLATMKGESQINAYSFHDIDQKSYMESRGKDFKYRYIVGEKRG